MSEQEKIIQAFWCMYDKHSDKHITQYEDLIQLWGYENGESGIKASLKYELSTSEKKTKRWFKTIVEKTETERIVCEFWASATCNFITTIRPKENAELFEEVKNKMISSSKALKKKAEDKRHQLLDSMLCSK